MVRTALIALTLWLAGCASSPAQPKHGQLSVACYNSLSLQGDDGLPIIVLTRVLDWYDIPDDKDGYCHAGIYMPDTESLRLIDRKILAVLHEEYPNQPYLRQYAGFYITSKHDRDNQQAREAFLMISFAQLSSLKHDAELAEAFPQQRSNGWPNALLSLIDVDGGGDKYGQGLYNVETDELVYLDFNGPF